MEPVRSPQQVQVLADLLELVLAVRPRERALIGIDGPDGAGKSTLTSQLVAMAQVVSGRQVLAVCVDDFAHPGAVEDTRGRDAEGYYRHAFDYEALRRLVLDPFRRGREIVPARHGLLARTPVSTDPIEPDDDAVLLVDGLFVQRPELARAFDEVLLVTADLEVTLPRANARDGRPAELGDPDHPDNARVVGAQRLYAYELRNQGEHWPTWILDNTDLARPRLIDPDPEDQLDLPLCRRGPMV